MSKTELQSVLDWILNKANDAEFEVVVKACERKRRDAALFSKLGGANPEKMAKNLSAEISQSMGASMDSLRTMVKGYVKDIILQNESSITETQLETLLEEYVPEPGSVRRETASNIPPEAMLTMARQFFKYASGAMSPSEQKQLWEEGSKWYESYWNAFPPDIRTLLDACVKGRIDEETCFGAIMSILRL